MRVHKPPLESSFNATNGADLTSLPFNVTFTLPNICPFLTGALIGLLILVFAFRFLYSFGNSNV